MMHRRSESSDSIKDMVKEHASKGAKLLVKTYLYAYNLSALIGWMLILIMLCLHMLFRTHLTAMYHSLIIPLIVVQSLAILEPVHAMLGITRNRMLPVLMQVSSRLCMTWVIVFWCNTGAHLCFPLMLMAWSLADITRLMFYLCKEIKWEREWWMRWCEEVATARYTWFIGLYPIGALCEWILIYRAWSTFSPVNTFFHIIFLSIMVIWPLGFTFMYSHMLHQRHKRIN